MTFKWKTNVIGAILSINPSITNSLTEVSDADSGRDSDFIDNRRNGTIDIECNYVPQNTHQAGMIGDILAANTSGAFSIEPAGTPATGDVTLAGTALITQVSMSKPEADKMTVSISLQITGTITRTVTPS
jgi:hypothetical protein